MPTHFTAGAVVYAKDLSTLSAFYAGAAELNITHSEADHVVLASSVFQLVVVAIPRAIADTIHITAPPTRREDTAVKLVLPVTSIAAARGAAQALGGELNAPEKEWSFQGARLCDGHDPEGNVVQFRESSKT